MFICNFGTFDLIHIVNIGTLFYFGTFYFVHIVYWYVYIILNPIFS